MSRMNQNNSTLLFVTDSKSCEEVVVKFISSLFSFIPEFSLLNYSHVESEGEDRIE